MSVRKRSSCYNLGHYRSEKKGILQKKGSLKEKINNRKRITKKIYNFHLLGVVESAVDYNRVHGDSAFVVEFHRNYGNIREL